MADWFRNIAWSDEIASTFEVRLGRARDKAQYLNIQAYTLLATRPDVAASLSRRAIELNDPTQTARAGLYLGTALATLGDLDAAIIALESAIEAEQREPMHRTAAHLDQALLVALAERTEMYDLALKRMERESILPFGDQCLSALIAQALIRGERGEDVAGIAEAALEALGTSQDGHADLPHYLSIDTLKGRLKAIACK